jgi:hypothetical protein
MGFLSVKESARYLPDAIGMAYGLLVQGMDAGPVPVVQEQREE